MSTLLLFQVKQLHVKHSLHVVVWDLSQICGQLNIFEVLFFFFFKFIQLSESLQIKSSGFEVNC